jgi:hypothetical protein
MNSPFLKFFTISFTNLLIGGGSGVLTAWCMTAHENDRGYQMALAEGMWAIGALFGLLLGWIAYYGIYRKRVTYEIVCTVVTATGMITALSAYILQKLTGEGGWLVIFFVVPVFFVTVILTHNILKKYPHNRP